MAKIILIYANCMSTTALGDFSLAGNIAKDLVDTLAKGGSEVGVVLTSRLESIDRFYKLYGNPIGDTVKVEGIAVRLVALELVDGIKEHVIAFIESNRCSYAPAELVKKVLSPDSKFIFVGAPNTYPIDTPLHKKVVIDEVCRQQPGIFYYVGNDDIEVHSSGFGKGRVGLPLVKKSTELGELLAVEKSLIPRNPYGFIYLAKISLQDTAATIAQYIQLTGYGEYVLVGDFSKDFSQIQPAVARFMSINGKVVRVENLPDIFFHNSLENSIMRQMAKKSGKLVVSTGINSTIEVLRDEKLPFYQVLENNSAFIASYLLAVQSICSSDATLVGAMPAMVIELSELLFAKKPLSSPSLTRLQDLLAIHSVSDKLADTNLQIVARANGRVARQLLGFINAPPTMASAHTPCVTACMELRKPGEVSPPIFDQALRRAGTWGRLFELRVLLNNMTVEECNKRCPKGRTALHYAALGDNIDCARCLIRHGVDLDLQDVDGRTPLHEALAEGNRELAGVLIRAGASLELRDNAGRLPGIGADTSLQLFINSAKAMSLPYAL
jgi:hypothetical protein